MAIDDETNLVQSLRIRQSSTVVALVVLLYEYVITFRSELRYIWRRPFKVNQAVYLFSRYLVVATQCVNAYLVLGPHSSLSMNASTCRKWQLFQALTAYATTGALHLTLMLMVYALHLQDYRVGLYLGVLYSAHFTVQGLVTPNAVWHITYNAICDVVEVHRDVMFIGISTWLTYGSLAALTAMKRNVFLLGVPVAKRVVRDGGLTIVLLCPLFTTMLCYSFARQIGQAHVIFGWSTTIMSIACCRIIMNMMTLEHQGQSQPEHTVGFNSLDNLQLMRLEMERRDQVDSRAENVRPVSENT
ncbi:hypothetical protein CVT26_008411 [Gymnopilus dilepis]|uniref:DUF6533 domain-containing protein n=1 Tax=Gymnopilus dilepis TaxID=231916 RepID=A0A409WNU8_9AGAR|nr:hypothetical protein CVT26_008411 [Gymnopilus dilepis]